MSWKISKLRIKNFKAFSNIELDFENSSLLTLDGPNGYGKTTVFDAIELLFTGTISRVEKLFNIVMPKGQKNYKDNLYWNTKSGANDLCIAAELVNEKGEILSFARVADVASLNIESNNRADKFDIFQLFELSNFDSIEYNNKKPTNYLEKYFGENFCKNYPLLNYLQQGQNSFIFGTTLTKRKDDLEGLLESSTIKAEISACGDLVRALAKKVPDPVEISDLKNQIEFLQAADKNIPKVDFEKISTSLQPPLWDTELPFVTYDALKFDSLISDVNILLSTFERKEEVRIRKNNESIEGELVKNKKLIPLAILIGKHISRFDDLKNLSIQIAKIEKAIVSLNKGGKSFLETDLVFLTNADIIFDANIISILQQRDNISQSLDGKSLKVIDLQKARKDLLAKYNGITEKHDSSCPMCGHDWTTYELLLSAVDGTSIALGKEIGALATDLEKLIEVVTNFISPLNLIATTRKIELEINFSKDIFDEISKYQEQFENISQLNASFAAKKVDYPTDFTSDKIQLAERESDLISKLRSFKLQEGEELPANWNQIINSSFAKIDDFYNLNSEKIVRKVSYIRSKHYTLQNAALTTAKSNLENLKNRARAVEKTKEKITTLKAVLVTKERDYSMRTISDIELIFHIYSGRLIQNYQRGLGLFIDPGNGSKLQFCTAEQSEHDATLSMSSGQTSALSLAFFLSLNRVYSKNPFILIDDPAQSLDEINIASLTDLLRCELSDRQLIMSSHEDEISAYMRYRFFRAGLTQKPFHMQSLADGDTQSYTNEFIDLL